MHDGRLVRGLVDGDAATKDHMSPRNRYSADAMRSRRVDTVVLVGVALNLGLNNVVHVVRDILADLLALVNDGTLARCLDERVLGRVEGRKQRLVLVRGNVALYQ